MMSDPQLTGYFANFMVEVSREHKEIDEIGDIPATGADTGSGTAAGGDRA
jgi:hypothetical protein